MESDRILKRLDGCTACVCYNDEIASKLVKVLQSAEVKVPDQISVIGIDNSSLARFCEVPITSVNNPANEMESVQHRLYWIRLIKIWKCTQRNLHRNL